MERHTTWRRLGTYTVNGHLIQNVVDFIQSRLPHILQYGDGTVSGQSSFYDETALTIYGSGSSMIYKPVNKFTQSRFNNDVQVVSFDLACKDGNPAADEARAVVLQLRFGTTSEDTDLSVAVQDRGAREKALMIEDGVLRILDRNKNRNHLFYPNDFVPTLVFVLGFIIGLGGLMFGNILLKSICIAIFGAAVYFVGHRFIRGYCSFDSGRQYTLDLFFRWLTRAVIIFVIVVIIRFIWNAVQGS